MNTPSPEEPLAESAPLAERLALALCRPQAGTGEACTWYHGFWQYLRLMGLAKTSGGQAAFLVEALRGLARTGASPRVLVSGSADYSTPAHAIAAYRAEAAPLQLTVLDRCETPLALSRWYAERQGTTIATRCTDIIDVEATEPIDVVFTNSFLGSFDPARRPRLVMAWRRLLRPGGTLIFTNRLRPNQAADVSCFDAGQVRGFTEAARREAERLRETVDLDPDEVARRAATYAERYRSYPVRSVDEITGLLDEGGFKVEHLEVVTNPGRQGAAAVSGPSTAERAEYAKVMATRR